MLSVSQEKIALTFYSSRYQSTVRRILQTLNSVDVCLAVIQIFSDMTTNSHSARYVLDPQLRGTTVYLCVRHKLARKDCNCQFRGQLPSIQVCFRLCYDIIALLVLT